MKYKKIRTHLSKNSMVSVVRFSLPLRDHLFLLCLEYLGLK